MEISKQTIDRVVNALNIAIALASIHNSPMYADLVTAAGAFDDAINGVEKTTIDPTTLAIGAYYKHLKTGGVYQLLMTATIVDTLTPVVVYGTNDHGTRRVWIRPLDEFCDGRFAPVDMSLRNEDPAALERQPARNSRG